MGFGKSMGTLGGVPPRPVSISGRQNVFRHVLGQFTDGRVCSATSWIDFWSEECVPPRPRSISGLQSVFRHVLVGSWYLIWRFSSLQNLSLLKKLNFPKFTDGHSMVSQQETHEILEPISKDPLCLDARDLKIAKLYVICQRIWDSFSIGNPLLQGLKVGPNQSCERSRGEPSYF